MPDVTHYERDILIANIHLDPENPRLSSIAESDRDALRRMYGEQKDKVLNLADHIAKNGLNPAVLAIVTPHPEDSEQFVSLDANRRLTAIKLLANPMLGEEFLPPSAFSRLKGWHKLFEDRKIDTLRAVVFPDPEAAVLWIELMHGGEQGGAGHVDWVLGETERFHARRGKQSIELQLLELVTSKDLITEQERRFIDREGISTFRRLVNTPEVREQLGITIDRQQKRLSFTYPEADVLKGIARILSDIAGRKKSSRDLNTRPQRIDYVNKLSAVLPDKRKALPAPLYVPPNDPSPAMPGKKGTRARGSSLAERKTLAPRLRLSIAPTRIKRMLLEATTLDVERFPNAAAVLFRVFLELTVDEGIKNMKIEIPIKKSRSPNLREKILGMATELEKRNIFSKAEAKAIRKAVNDTTVGADIDTLNQYVHSASLNPKPRDLTIAWDNVQVLFEKVWR